MQDQVPRLKMAGIGGRKKEHTIAEKNLFYVAFIPFKFNRHGSPILTPMSVH